MARKRLTEEIYLKMYGQNKKSVGVSSFDDFEFIQLQGTKKRKYYKYNLTKLLNDLDGEMAWQN